MSSSVGKPVDLSIVIVNWKSVDFLRKCLASIYSNEPAAKFEIVVIDNDSGDSCGEMLTREFPQVRFIQSRKNLGFAGANNAAFRHTSGRNILFLNPDTEVLGSALDRMLEVLDEREDVGIVGPKLLNTDGTLQTSCIRSFPTLLNEALDSEFLREKFKRSFLWGMKPLFSQSSQPSRVDAVSGASLMIKRTVFEAIGQFTTSYFMYAEDVDLCWKAREAGWKTLFIPDAVVIHHGGKSSGSRHDKNFADVVMRESRYRLFRLRRSAAYAWSYKVITLIAAMARVGFMSIARLDSRYSFVELSYSHRKWLRIMRWSLGLESWASRLNQSVTNDALPLSSTQDVSSLVNRTR